MRSKLIFSHKQVVFRGKFYPPNVGYTLSLETEVLIECLKCGRVSTQIPTPLSGDCLSSIPDNGEVRWVEERNFC